MQMTQGHVPADEEHKLRLVLARIIMYMKRMIFYML